MQKIVLFLIISFSPNLMRAQSVNDCIQLADTFFAQQKFEIAIKYYSRIQFFSPEGLSINNYIKLGEAYYQIGEYDKALAPFEFAYNLSENDSIKIECIYARTACYLQLQKYSIANSELSNIDTSLLNTLQIKRLRFYEAIAFFGMKQFTEAERCIMSCISEKYVIERTRIHKIFTKKRFLRKPNPKLTKLASIMLPGTGQIISGNIKDGINSLAINYLLLSTAIFIAEKYTYFDALMAIGPWFQRYYEGGYQNAAILAEKKQQEKQNRYLKEIIFLLKKCR